MAAIDWNKLESEGQGQYKPYADEGTYTTTIDKVELVKSKNKGTPGLQIHFADNDDYAFPKFGTTVWLGEKVAWFARPVYMKNLLVVLGVAEDAAMKAVEGCEDKDGEARDKAYLAIVERAVAKNKGVNIVIYREYANDKYPRVDFADTKIRIGREKKENKSMSIDDAFAGAEEVLVSDIPF